MQLENKKALITGAGSGIGRESAVMMAERGAAVMCADIDLESATNTANVIKQAGGAAEAMALDVADAGAFEAGLKQSQQALGGLNVIFNNAGIAGDRGWDDTIAVNLTGVYYGLYFGAPLLAEQGGGVIINTASVAGLVGLTGPQSALSEDVALAPGAGAYVAAKHGVAGLTKQYAVTFGKSNVRVNAIAPGYIETPMTAGARDIPGAVDYLASLHPIGRLGQPEEIASVAAFLASDEASFVTGIIMPVDGGYTAR